MRAVEVAEHNGALDVLPATDEAKRRDIWESRRLLSAATRRLRKTKVSEDIVVPRSKIPEMVARVGELGERHGLMTCAFGHAGDGNLHVQVLFDDPDADMARVEALVDDILPEDRPILAAWLAVLDSEVRDPIARSELARTHFPAVVLGAAG